MKKIDFFNSAKLLTMTIGLILGAFVMLSMAFPEEGSGNSDNSSEYVEEYPNDSTNTGYNRGRTSHWTTSGSCGSTTYHNKTDYGKAIVETKGHGRVSISGTNDKSVSSNQSSSEVGSQAYVTWNTGYGPNDDTGNKSSSMAAAHQNNITLIANADSGYQFDHWEDEGGTNIGTDPTIERMATIPGGDSYGDREYQTYQDSNSPYTVTFYAFFKEKEMDFDVTLIPANSEYGSYSNNNVAVQSETNVSATDGSVTVNLQATSETDCSFVSWYTKKSDGTIEVLSHEPTYQATFDEAKTIYACFVPNDASRWLVGATEYADLNEANAVARSSKTDKMIVCISDGILPSGEYTISQGVTLLIPFNAANTCYTTEPFAGHGHYNVDENGNYSASISSSNYHDPSDRDYNIDRSTLYRMLTLAEGAVLTIEGTLSISADRWCVYDTGNNGKSKPNLSGNFRIDQGYGMINMNEGSVINVGNATNKPEAKLYCWGRIRGEGEINVEENAEVHESIVFTDYRETDSLGYYAQSTKCFPFTQYYIQDIQVPISFNYGAKEILRTGLYGTKKNPIYQGIMQLVGSDEKSLIKIPEGGSFKKSYNIPTDRLILDLYNGTSFHSAELAVSIKMSIIQTIDVNAPTNTHIFPITNNWTINFHPSATPYEIHYDLGICAGAELNIEEGAHLKLTEGASLYVYDREEWKDFPSIGNDIIPLFLPEYERNHNTYDGVTLYEIAPRSNNYKYTAIRRSEGLQDAAIKVNGTFTISGGENTIYKGTKYGSAIKPRNNSGLYTTESGANIYSTANGQIIYSKGSGDQEKVPQIYKSGKTVKWVDIAPAQLKNADGVEPSYTATDGASGMSTFKYFSEDGKWKKVSKVTFVSDGQEFAVDSVAQGDVITSPTEGLPTKAGYELTGWSNISKPMGTTDIVSEAQWTAKVTTIEVKPEEVIISDTEESIENHTYTITETTEANKVTINEGAKINVATDASLTITEALVIKASENNSGDLLAADKIEIANNVDVYFDYTFNTSQMRWNAIAFPWQVDATSGVQVDGKTLTLGKDFDIIYYDGAIRAARGPVDDCWKYVEDDINAGVITDPAILVPGRLYMILFAQAQDVVRFAKKADAPLVNTEVGVAEYSGSSQDANWNGIANPTLYHAFLKAGVEEGQIYNNADDSYLPIPLASTSFPVGKPVFVQVAQEPSVVVSKEQPANAPMRAASSTTNLRAEVEIMANNVATDKVIVRTDEDALNEYTIGSDLAKAGVSSKVAQLWVNRYGTQLCKNTIAPLYDVAEYPLTIFAPTTGAYTLAIRSINSECALYLTQNGEAIADLTQANYTISLTKGNHSEYGLRLVIKQQPGVVTSLDEALMLRNVHKVIYRENLYIIRNKHIYNAAGQFIK